MSSVKGRDGRAETTGRLDRRETGERRFQITAVQRGFLERRLVLVIDCAAALKFYRSFAMVISFIRAFMVVGFTGAEPRLDAARISFAF